MRNTSRFQSIFHLTLSSPIRSDYACYSTHTGDTGELYECVMLSTHFDLNQLQQRTLENSQLIESQPNFVSTHLMRVSCAHSMLKIVRMYYTHATHLLGMNLCDKFEISIQVRK